MKSKKNFRLMILLGLTLSVLSLNMVRLIICKCMRNPK